MKYFILITIWGIICFSTSFSIIYYFGTHQ